MLNMRSDAADEAERTGRARIRDAAFRLFAAGGFETVTVRAIATEAGVSPALVIHHFGSVAGLREEIDRWVLDRFHRWMESAALAPSTGAIVDETARELRDFFREEPLLGAYLRQLLIAGGEAGYEFFAELFEGARSMMSELERRGLVRPAPPGAAEARLALLAAEDLGTIMLEPYLSRVMGTPIFSAEVMDRWHEAELDMHAHGIFTPAASEGTAT
jgi:AcrR family transcriptional regulator